MTKHHPCTNGSNSRTHPAHLALGVMLLAIALAACGSDAVTTTSDGSVDLDGGATSDDVTSDGATSDAAAGADAAAVGDTLTGDDATNDATTGDAGAPAPRPFLSHKMAIAGVWQSSFGGNETVSDDAWATGFGTSVIVKIDNSNRVVFTQNAKDDKYYPGKFNKITWTAPNQTTVDGFQVWATYYCIVDFGLPSLALAEQTTQTADASTPEKSGCGGFPWTKLSALETIGAWTTNFASPELINRQAWGYGWVRAFDNGKNVAYTQNPADATYGPKTWSKVVWTTPVAGTWSYCTVDFGLADLAAAKSSTKTADANDLTGKGCGGFGWTQMTATK